MKNADGAVYLPPCPLHGAESCSVTRAESVEAVGNWWASAISSYPMPDDMSLR